MVEYRMDEDARLCVFTGRGDVTVEDITGARRAAISDERWESCRRILYDYRHAILTDLDYGRLRVGAERDRSYDRVVAGRSIAVVADEDSAYGLMRIWKTLSEGRPLHIEIFRTLKEALDFLGIEDAEAAGF